MDPEHEKSIIMKHHFLTKEELFARHTVVSIIPLDWWRSWCLYVGLYGEKSGEPPGLINTSALSLADSSNHAYISRKSWRYLKSWYESGPAIDVFIINNKPDLNPIKVTVEHDTHKSKVLQISIAAPIIDIKNYICKRFHIEPTCYKLKIKNQSGYLKNLKYMNGFIDKADLVSGSLMLTESGSMQISITFKGCDEEVKEEATVFDKNKEIEMQDINIWKEEEAANIEAVLRIKEDIKQATEGEKLRLRIKSLKKLRVIIADVQSKLDSQN